jgi:hypothetical protein
MYNTNICGRKKNSKRKALYFYRILLALCLFSLLLSFFCNKAFFERFSPDGQIIDVLYITYISLLRFFLITISVVILFLCLFKKYLIRDWDASVTNFKNACNRKMSVAEIFPQPPFLLTRVLMAILLIWCFFIAYNFYFHRAFLENLATTENGVTETLTVIFYLLAAILAVISIFYYGRKGINLGMQKWCLMVIALFFVFVAMEEMSWGQTYFGYKTPDRLFEVNVQQEVSLHNIPLPTNEDWAKIVLHFLAASIGIIIPVVSKLCPLLATFIWTFGVPLPSSATQLAFIIATLIPTDKFARSLGLFNRVNTFSELREVTCAAAFFILICDLYYTNRNFNKA